VGNGYPSRGANFARIYSMLRVTPAMEAGITRHVWTIKEIVNLLDYSFMHLKPSF
jgi:hypothetical protein